MAKRFGDASGPFAEVAGHVVLTEVAARGVEDERLLLAELVIQET